MGKTREVDVFNRGEVPRRRIMSFKVKDLAVSLSGPLGNDGTTCTTLTMTGSGCADTSPFLGAREHRLAVLKVQLRNAMSRA
jgi:hypothetical protein